MSKNGFKHDHWAPILPTEPMIFVLTHVSRSVKRLYSNHFDFLYMSLIPVPENLQRATHRLEFPPSYVVVGIYRLFTDKSLWEPAWVKCAHALRRGAIVGTVWALATFSIQRKFIEIFLAKCVVSLHA